eukprot:6468366-Amphidinium_carterae.2
MARAESALKFFSWSSHQSDLPTFFPWAVRGRDTEREQCGSCLAWSAYCLRRPANKEILCSPQVNLGSARRKG